MDIREELNRRILLCDGGMGTLLQSAGLRPGERPEIWNLEHPETVRGFHLDYLKAGADIIAANTFGANRFHYPAGGRYGLKELVEAAIGNARLAVREAGHGFVGLDLGPSGKLLAPLGDLSFEESVSSYAEVVEAGAKSGADLVLIETMSDLRELKAAVLAAKEQSALPVFATVTLDANGRLLTGGTVETVTALLEGLGVDALGLNCSLDPVQMLPIARRFVEASSLPVIINPNAGLPRMEDGKTFYDVGPEEFAEGMKAILALGVSVVGGCCGTTPEHIALLKRAAEGMEVPGRRQRSGAAASSSSSLLAIGGGEIRIGACISEEERDEVLSELLEGDYETVIENAMDQKDEGAEALLLRTGLPSAEEAELLPDLIEELQMTVDLPLVICASSVESLGKALRIYNGRPLVDTSEIGEERREEIQALAEKYGAVILS